MPRWNSPSSWKSNFPFCWTSPVYSHRNVRLVSRSVSLSSARSYQDAICLCTWLEVGACEYKRRNFVLASSGSNHQRIKVYPSRTSPVPFLPGLNTVDKLISSCAEHFSTSFHCRHFTKVEGETLEYGNAIRLLLEFFTWAFTGSTTHCFIMWSRL